MTNRPSEIIGNTREFTLELGNILDSHAARLESLERDAKLRPAIATRWAECPVCFGTKLVGGRRCVTCSGPEPSPQSEWPSDVVKVWESVGDPICRWALYDSGKIYISHRNEPLNNYPALAKKAELDGGVSDTGRTIRTVYSRYPSEAEVQREIDTICDRVAATRPSPPVQSEQPGKHEGYYKAPGGHWYRCDIETTDYCVFVKCDPPKGVPA